MKKNEKALQKQSFLQRSFAKKITADLFTNGMKQRAEILKLISENGEDLGGWCEAAMTNRIHCWLAKFMHELRKEMKCQEKNVQLGPESACKQKRKRSTPCSDT